MNLVVRLLGVEVFALCTSDTDDDVYDAGDCTTTPIGFGGYHGDQRYDSSPGIDLE